MPVLVLSLFLLLFAGSCAQPKADDLHAAARSGDPERVKTALGHGIDVNQIADGTTALHVAVKAGRPENVTLLLAKGADSTALDSKGRTAWQSLWDQKKAFFSKAEGECAVALLEGGVKPGELEGSTYLHAAAHKVDSSKLIGLLIESGIDVNAKDRYGWTPLHFAAGKPNFGNVEALLSAKADPNAESTEVWENAFVDAEGAESVTFRYQVGTRPLDVARHSVSRNTGSNRKSPHALLREWGAKENPSIKNTKAP